LTFFFASSEKVDWDSFGKYIVFFFAFFLFFGKNANAQCSLGCISSVNVSLDNDGEYQITPATLLSSPLKQVRRSQVL